VSFLSLVASLLRGDLPFSSPKSGFSRDSNSLTLQLSLFSPSHVSGTGFRGPGTFLLDLFISGIPSLHDSPLNQPYDEFYVTLL